jgi:uncharacterized protein (DUF2345 family)
LRVGSITLSGSGANIGLNASNGVHINGGSYVSIYGGWVQISAVDKITSQSSGAMLLGTWYSDNGFPITSDRNKKHSISELSNNYDTFFTKLKPISYKLNNGTSDRFHVGFIS